MTEINSYPSSYKRCPKCGEWYDTIYSSSDPDYKVHKCITPKISQKEETHTVCNKRLKEEGGKAKCCYCVKHSGCELSQKEICKECQFEGGEHSFECSKYKEPNFEPKDKYNINGKVYKNGLMGNFDGYKGAETGIKYDDNLKPKEKDVWTDFWTKAEHVFIGFSNGGEYNDYLSQIDDEGKRFIEDFITQNFISRQDSIKIIDDIFEKYRTTPRQYFPDEIKQDIIKKYK
jgi:hypothetical protein